MKTSRNIARKFRLLRFSKLTPKLRNSGKHANLKLWVVGLHLYNLKDIYHHVRTGTDLILKREREANTISENIAVYYKHFKLGYLPSDNNNLVRTILDRNSSITSTVVQLTKEKFMPTRGIKLEISYGN